MIIRFFLYLGLIIGWMVALLGSLLGLMALLGTDTGLIAWAIVMTVISAAFLAAAPR